VRIAGSFDHPRHHWPPWLPAGRRAPGRYTATVGARFTGDDDPLLKASSRVIELIAAVLRGYRISDDDMVHAIRAVRCTLHGFAMLQATNAFQWSGDIDDSFEKLIDFIDGGLRGQRG